VLESIHSSLWCTLLRRLVQPAYDPSYFRAAIVELKACSTAHQVSSLYVVRRRRSTIRSDVVGRRYGRFLRHPSPRAVAVAPRLRRFRPRVPVVIHRRLELVSDLTVLASVTLDSDDISSSSVAVDIFRRLHRLAIFRIVLFCLLNTIFVLFTIIDVIVVALHCFDIICLLLILRALS